MKAPKRKQEPKPSDIELVPDAWLRFERFIKEIVKAGPQHRTKTPAAKKKKPHKSA